MGYLQDMIAKVRLKSALMACLIAPACLAVGPAILHAQDAPPAATGAASDAAAPEAPATPTPSEPTASPLPSQTPDATATSQPSAAPADPGATPVQDLPTDGFTPNSAGAAPSATPGEPVASTGPNPNLPHDLSPWGMYQQADLVVKSVMIGLAFASVITWTVWLVKSFELFSARARLTRALRAIGQDASLSAAAQTLGNRGGLMRALIEVAVLELRMSTDTPDKNGIKERVASRLERVESAAVRNMNKGTGVLATIGATAPFVGLFGTVWGIMNSFIGISKSQTTNLAVVAPGIAEALLATAIGLVAAIPAVIIYNWFSRGIGVYRALAGDASAEVMRLVSRDLDRVAVVHRHARAAE